MASVEIYTQQFCPYCHWAKELLSRKGVGFDEIDVTADTQARQAMSARALSDLDRWIADNLHIAAAA